MIGEKFLNTFRQKNINFLQSQIKFYGLDSYDKGPPSK